MMTKKNMYYMPGSRKTGGHECAAVLYFRRTIHIPFLSAKTPV